MSIGAMTLAEGSQKKDYRTDATMVLKGSVERGNVLRTAYDSLSVWKAKYGKGVSPFYPRLKVSVKEAALIDDEIWVFGVDCTNSCPSINKNLLRTNQNRHLHTTIYS